MGTEEWNGSMNCGGSEERRSQWAGMDGEHPSLGSGTKMESYRREAFKGKRGKKRAF